MAIVSWYKCKLKNLDPAVPTKMVLMSIKFFFFFFAFTALVPIIYTLLSSFSNAEVFWQYLKRCGLLRGKNNNNKNQKTNGSKIQHDFLSQGRKHHFWLGTCFSADNTGEAPSAATPWRCLIYSTNNSVELSNTKKKEPNPKNHSGLSGAEFTGTRTSSAFSNATELNTMSLTIQDPSLCPNLCSLSSTSSIAASGDGGAEKEEGEEEGVYRDEEEGD